MRDSFIEEGWVEAVFIFSMLSLKYLLDLVEILNYILPKVRYELGPGENNFGSCPSIGGTG